MTSLRYSPPTKAGVTPSRVVLPEGTWLSVLDFLVQRFPNVAGEEWQRRMSCGDVLDDVGAPLAPSTPYHAQRTVFYYRHVPDEPSIPFVEEVLYQDEWLVAIDKPHFVPVIATGRYLQESLIVRLKRKLGIDSLAPLHRLDRETAGVVLFSIQPHSRAAYAGLFREHRVSKVYEAIAPRTDARTFPLTHRSRLEELARHKPMHEVTGEPNSQTTIERLETKGPLARYRLTPLTGKKHQLRAHMAALDIPILNDRLYPLRQRQADPLPNDYSRPLQLLAKSIAFVDPMTGGERFFSTRQGLRF